MICPLTIRSPASRPIAAAKPLASTVSITHDASAFGRKVAPKPACSTKKAKGDRVIGTNDDSYFLLKLAGPYLLLDAGTGPDRAIDIFDLRSGKTLFSGGYDDETFKADATGASFFAATSTKATRKNCPDLAKIEKNWLTPVIEVRTRFDFATGTVTKSNDQRCRATQ